MARVRSVDFLPEIFQTETNKQFLAATLDQLIQEPKFKKTQGFIGRTVGPGVNPNDSYVVEPTKARKDYQLEAGMISLKPDTDEIVDVLTYPGLLDAVGYQGGVESRPDLLFSSDYYTWDPFIDFDSFVNSSQYYWLPNGPDAVTVTTGGIPAEDTINVTRNNNGYTFSDAVGNNPTLELIRGGSYTFNVAQNDKQTIDLRVQNRGLSAYIIDYVDNPNLTLVRGNTYVFNLSITGSFPLWIKTAPTTGVLDAYNTGVTRNGSTEGLITFVVPQNAPDTLYYIAENSASMKGTLNIVDGIPGTGPGFWIQTNPGVSGKNPITPNISSREILGVTNNGEDLGTITFNVPTKTAQQYYYNLPMLAQNVDLITDLKFDQINNQELTLFNATYNGIDGITSLNGRTLIFTNPELDPVDGGWLRTTRFDPLPQNSSSNGLPGSYDTTLFDQTLPISPDDYYQLWQISYQTVEGYVFLQLNKIADIPAQNKFDIRYGDVYSNTSWYKNVNGKFAEIPVLSAALDTLYYQDGIDPELFGSIKIVDSQASEVLYIKDIIGKTNYTAPNGVAFTNGLKVRFEGEIVPASYASGTKIFTYYETNSQNNSIVIDDTSILYKGQEIIFRGATIGGLVSGQTYYVRDIINDFEFTVSTVIGGTTVPLYTGFGEAEAVAINYKEYYVSGVGTAIQLLPVSEYITPESYVVDANDSTLAKEPSATDYITITRGSLNLNPWSRSNRWFHIDVINATASYNGTVVNLDNLARAKRPIIQFRENLRLYNMGTLAKAPVDIIDFSNTDAFSNIEGTTGYSVDGYTFVNGSRVIFANDDDPQVRNKIYIVEFITPDTQAPLIAQPIINLLEAPDGDVTVDNCVLCLYGTTTGTNTYWFDGTDWIYAQQKTGVQQAPLFNVYDANGISFSNKAVYPGSNFTGSKLFSYAAGDTTLLDSILKLPLKYLTISNVGDIVFDNNLYSDTFVYTRENVSTTLPISSGFVREYTSQTAFDRLLGWQDAVTTSQIYQQFKFTYTNSIITLDVPVKSNTSIPAVKVFIGSEFQDPTTYTYVVDGNLTVVDLSDIAVTDDIIEILVLSDQTSELAFYQVPVNLEKNPFNGNSQEFTLGTIRQHYQSICQNLTGLTGKISGANNTRDLGNIGPYGQIILQQSAPLPYAGYFMRSEQYNIFNALAYNSREYSKFKGQMLQAVTEITLNFQTTAQLLDAAIETITAGKIESQPFYWSDMLPSGAVYTETNYTFTYISTNTFDTVQVYDYASANYLGMDVYLNNEILMRGRDYTVATDGPRITVLLALSVGDVITIREYTTTAGSFVPNTPTKVGLYPAWRPVISTVKTSTGEQTVIIGHDGSQTRTFGDIRDDVLLEFETRIYNNLKLDGNPVPLEVYDVLPGQFRSTGFDINAINNILAQDFLSYVAWNKLDYKVQEYRANNAFTYNYSQSTNKLNNENLLGAWRGIYRYFYDTQQPEATPWEMLGFSVEPDWWQDTYGVAPYTGENMVLWDDLEAGIVRDPAGAYVLSAFVRKNLTQVIPNGTQGELLPPLDCVVGSYDTNLFRKSWSLGDGGPVEASWWNSSNYPFAVMRLLALTRPANFFSLFVDRDLYRYNTEFGQYLYNDRYRLGTQGYTVNADGTLKSVNGIDVYGNGVSKASYMNWIVDYNRLTGLDSTTDLQNELASLDVRLCYRMASFSDKKYIKLYTEKSSPNSNNTSFLIPDESYDLVLYKNQPFARVSYSSVLVQMVPGGYSVAGYSTTQPYFNILRSQAAGTTTTYRSGGITVTVPNTYTDTVVQIPYGYVFSNETAVADFLLGLGEFYKTQGMVFDSQANGYILSWSQMVNEFMYWSQQGWDDNALIALNPLATSLSVTKEMAVVDSVIAETAENIILDQNRREYPVRNLNIVRIDNTFTVTPLTDQTLSYIDLKYTSYEHMIVLNNVSVFGDLIYEPITGARQSRLNLVAVTSSEWNGSVDAQGFILNQNNIEEWSGVKTYTKGSIVKYKGVYWSALTIVQPSTDFNYSNWTQSDYTQIELGLLPNLANKANQLSNSYNINSANLETDNDLLSYGLIGFRPRNYLAALNLDDVSQVNIYREFLGTKGTLLSTDLFALANLGKEAGDYQIYENWAVQRAVYGANANRSGIALRLNRALLNASPSVIQIVNPQQTSQADQAIQLSDVWKQSFKLTSPDVLPTTTELPTDISLPNAGYVNLNDVDVTAFSIDNNADLNAVFSNIAVGTSIWVAKVNDYDWNVYRVNSVPGVIQHVCDNLNGTSIAIFSQQHGLSVGDRIVIRYFDTEVDGVYTVLAVPNLTTVTIAFQFIGQRTVVNGTGLAFTLLSQRVAQAADVVNLPYANDIAVGNKVWVDDYGNGRWATLEKQQVFDSVINIAPKIPDATEQFGSSVTQAPDRFAALVGSPRYGFPTSANPPGGVYVYVRSPVDGITPISPSDGDSVLQFGVAGVRGYGTTVDFGGTNWAAAGAPASLGSSGQTNNGYVGIIYRDPVGYIPGTSPYFNWQLLTTPASVVADQGRFGASLAMSLDERWLYVGSPDTNSVFCYANVPWQDQFVRYRGDTVTDTFSFEDQIQVTVGTQIVVTVDSTIQVQGTDYTVSGTDVVFTTPPALGADIYITRITSKLIDGDAYYNVTGTGGGGVGATFAINRVRNDLKSVGVINGGSGYTNGATITVPASSFGGGVDGVNDLTFTINTILGHVVSVSGITWTPPALQNTFSLNEYFYNVSTINSFTLLVNSEIQRPNIDYTFDPVTKDVTLVTSVPVGDEIVVRSKNYWQYVGALPAPSLSATDGFGTSISTSTDGRQILVGTPYTAVDGLSEAGTVYLFDRNVQRFTIVATSNNDFTVGNLYTIHSLGTTTQTEWNTIAGTVGQTYVVGDQFTAAVAGSGTGTGQAISQTITALGTVTEPVAVIVNNQFLINGTQAIQGTVGTFDVSGNDVTIYTTLNVGDDVQIETNQFALAQTITQDVPTDFTEYGKDIDLCSNNCSLYVGAPLSSMQIYKGGVVERRVNQSRIYGTISATVASPTLVAGETLRVNDVDVTVPVAPNNTVAGLATAINNTVSNVTATVASGILTIAVKNVASAAPTNKVQVAPGSIGTVFSTLGFETFAFTQTILSPYPVSYAEFGGVVSIDDTATTLVVSSPYGTMYLITIFDDNKTDFDVDATTFFSTINQSGAVYTYDYLQSANSSVSNPGKFVFGNAIEVSSLQFQDKFGITTDYTGGLLWIGAPQGDMGDSSTSNYGECFVFENINRTPAWTPIHVQQPTVDIRLLNSVFLYDRITSATTDFLDWFNPLQGKILGAAQQNIDYTGAVDPADYNVGPTGNRGTTWGAEHVGEVWWDVSTVRFIDPNQNDITYASRRWGQVFPGSTVDVYQWIVSTVPPANYTGPGTPYSITSYSVNTVLNSEGIFNTEYFYWVRGISEVATQKGKTLGVSVVSQYIENPKASGIAYFAPINASTYAIYNCETLIEAQDTILNIEFDRELTDSNIHVEYELIPQDRADGFLSQGLYRKLQDSFCGVDSAGNLVPDPTLGVAERYGVQFRPRQSMFVDRFTALENYITRTNAVLAQYPIVEMRQFTLLNSAEPLPASNSLIDPWNQQVATLEILSFQNIYAVPMGYKYLVDTDSSQRGLWTIYEVQPSVTDPVNLRQLRLIRVQNYNTPDYWSYINWYQVGYNSSIKPVVEVPLYSSLATLDVPVGSSVKVTANGQGKFEIYQLDITGWTRVGLEDGTIEFSSYLYDYAAGRFGFDVEVFDAQYFDQEPVIETRKIIQAINEELFIDELQLERNKLLTLTFNYILSEFSAPQWLVKTSLIDVDHRIRELIPYQNYTRDNQDFVLKYIQEVKPYHVEVREFNLRYYGNDAYAGDMTDFDVPAYYNTNLTVPQYTSPILLPYDHGTAYNSPSNTLSDVSSTNTIWQTWPWTQWYDNYLFQLDAILVTRNGSGYTSTPSVTITGDADVQATASAVINSLGQVIAINVLTPGSGYRSNPIITISGGNGSGAVAYPQISNALVRQFKTTIRFDRNQYQTSVSTWSPDGTYLNGTLVRYDNRVWEADSADGSSAVIGPVFRLEDWKIVNAATYQYPDASVPTGLTGVDRTMGLYVPGVNMPGLSLPLLVDGIAYPGVQVWGDYFLGTEILDAEYRSAFADIYLGERFTDINVNGGEFIGPYEGHAPEELVNGSEFDTLDMRVYTRPGSDWQMDGHGWQIGTTNFTWVPVTDETFSFANNVTHPVDVIVSNQETGIVLAKDIDYTVNWAELTVHVPAGPNVSTDDVISITAYELGGGSQLYRQNYSGSALASGTVVVPVNSSEIYTVAVFINGNHSGTPTWVPYADSTDWNILNSYAQGSVVLTNAPVTVTATNATNAIITGSSTLGLAANMAVTFSGTVFGGINTSTTYYVYQVVGQNAFSIATTPNASFPLALTAGTGSMTMTPVRAYYRAKDTVPVGIPVTNADYWYNFVPTLASELTLSTIPTATDGVEITVFGTSAPNSYSWSTPVTQQVLVTPTIASNGGFTLTNDISGTNIANMVVNKNGVRLEPPAGIEWFGDDSSMSFGLPQRLGASFTQNTINAATDIIVWVDNVLQQQTIGLYIGDYSVTPWDGSNTPGRQVVFNTPPAAGARILISVWTQAAYTVSGDQIAFNSPINVNDVMQVTTYNDTSQQNLLTLVFVGPVTTGLTVVEAFDTTTFDDGVVSGGPGTFDYSTGTVINSNDFQLSRTEVNASRLWVTLDGYKLYEGMDYKVVNGELILASGAIGSSQVLAVTEVTDSIVPEACAFRIFQDMRGVQATYRISDSTTTALTAPLSETADVMYVANARALGAPDPDNGRLGVVTVNGERIMYRERDIVNNFLSGLRRGTAGTSAASHPADAPVYDISRGNLLSEEYQDYLVSDTSVGDGSTTVFYAPSITNGDVLDSSSEVLSIEVYVGGTRQYAYSDTTATSPYRWVVTDMFPLTIEFFLDPATNPVFTTAAPPPGVEVTIVQRRGKWWYDISTALARNQALQENNSIAARFLSGRNGA